MQGQLIDISIDYLSKKPKIQLLLNSNEITHLEELKGLELDIEINKHKDHLMQMLIVGYYVTK